MTTSPDLITQADVHVVRVPLTTRFSTSNKTVEASLLVLVSLRSASGHVGWGEGALNPTFTHEAPGSARAALEDVLGRLVAGRSVEDAFAGRARSAGALGTGIAARCALSTALWDLRARVLGVPLHVLLGGARRATVPTTWPLGAFDAEQDARAAREATDAGFTILKLKVGRPDVQEDLAAVRRLREVAGPGPRLYVDVNQGWTRTQASTFLAEAPSLGVHLVEQPVPAQDVDGLAELSRTTGTAVGADESVHDAGRLLALLRAGSAPAAVVVKLLKAGGVDGVLDLLRLSQLAGVLPFPAGMPGDTSIASAAMLHLALAAEELPLGTAVTPHFSREDVAAPALPVVRGHLDGTALRGAGLGIDVDPGLVRHLEVA